MAAYDFAEPVTQLSMEKQVEEIDRRLAIVYEDCQARQAPMTLAHIRVALGIDDNTFIRWKEGRVNRKINGEKKDVDVDRSNCSEAEKQIIHARRDCLKKWIQRAELATVEAIAANPKAGGPVFIAKSVFRYQEYEKNTPVNINVTLEDFLASVSKTTNKEAK